MLPKLIRGHIMLPIQKANRFVSGDSFWYIAAMASTDYDFSSQEIPGPAAEMLSVGALEKMRCLLEQFAPETAP